VGRHRACRVADAAAGRIAQGRRADRRRRLHRPVAALHLAEAGVRCACSRRTSPAGAPRGATAGRSTPRSSTTPTSSCACTARRAPRRSSTPCRNPPTWCSTSSRAIASTASRCAAAGCRWPIRRSRSPGCTHAHGNGPGRGVPTRMLDRAAVTARLGTQAFAGGWLDGRAGGIQPLAYTRGLVRAAQASGRGGARRHRAVAALERQGVQWRATTVDRRRRHGRPSAAGHQRLHRRAVAEAVAHRAGRQQLHRRDRAAVGPRGRRYPAGRRDGLDLAAAAAVLPQGRAGPPADGRARPLRRSDRPRAISRTWSARSNCCSRS
jgi:hypothetical protein